MVTGADALATMRADRAGSRRKSLALAAAILAAALLSLCQGVSAPGTFYTPAQVAGV